jgi:hypothetical protein
MSRPTRSSGSTRSSITRATFRPGDRESLLATAPALLALANNRAFLVERIHAELDGDAFQAGNDYTAQTFLLGRGDGFLVRANVWTPADAVGRDRLFFYSVPHDHGFDFLTVGYHGPGYETDLYEYERDAIAGVPDEPVALTARGRERLTPGRVMFYRAFRDVHTQHPPAALSISLNLLAVDRAELREQLFFDVARGRVAGPVPGGAERRVLLCEMAGLLGDPRSDSLLDQLAARHPCPRTRAAARRARTKPEASSSSSLRHTAAG